MRPQMSPSRAPGCTVAPLLIGLLAGCALLLSAIPAAAAQSGLDAHDLALLNRITWGADSADAARLQSLGPRRWLQSQLHPSPADSLPAAVQARIDALPVASTPVAELLAASQVCSHQAKLVADNDQRATAKQACKAGFVRLAQQSGERELLRDIYSPAQLREQLAWFWLNYFNVDTRHGELRVLIGDYEDSAIRSHALGHFRDLLAASLRHPAMLIYLDNASSSRGAINENYARELMELHTLGVDAGYTQQDVQELARILTGLRVYAARDLPAEPPELAPQLVRQGLFLFDPSGHDYGDKLLLGHHIKGRGLAEVDEAIDILVRHPATARHVSQRLALYFLGQPPSPALVERMAATFTRSDGDIAQVLQTLFASSEFDRSLGQAFKDPMHYLVSAVRQAYDGRTITEALPIESWLSQLGEGLYVHPTPDGYPLNADAWNASGQLAARFEVARQFAATPPSSFGIAGGEAPLLQTARFETGLGSATRDALAQSRSPQERLILYLSSPEFMRR